MDRILELQSEWEKSIDPAIREMTWRAFLKLRAPYPFCGGNPTFEDCIRVGYCRREIACNN
jgi:hypothetical protein